MLKLSERKDMGHEGNQPEGIWTGARGTTVVEVEWRPVLSTGWNGSRVCVCKVAMPLVKSFAMHAEIKEHNLFTGLLEILFEDGLLKHEKVDQVLKWT